MLQQNSGYDTASIKPPSAYGWRYHLDNTIQFILWASFGSAAIHLLSIKQTYSDKERRLSTKIAVLKDVIRRVQDGEDVDIAKELKTGQPEEEKEWEEVMNHFREEAAAATGSTSVESHSAMSCIGETKLNNLHRPVEELKANLPDSKSSSSGWFWHR